VTEEIEKGDLVRFNPTKYVLNRRLRRRSWGTSCGYYLYRVVTLGRKWATLRLSATNVRKLMPIAVWEEIVKRNDFVKIVDGKVVYVNRSEIQNDYTS
jgi:hypothetical protein